MSLTNPIDPGRGEVWDVNFAPQVGDEIAKIRPAVVLNIGPAQRLRLRIVVPVTEWDASFANFAARLRTAANFIFPPGKSSQRECRFPF